MCSPVSVHLFRIIILQNYFLINMSFNCENSKGSSHNELNVTTDLIIVKDSTKRKCSKQFFSLKRTKKEDEIK